ncbi:hypothetical protein E8E11_010865 [Didymella keratinophila]|nr:hypothetical protein E8E11_010865 [Didymella keratinophila]
MGQANSRTGAPSSSPEEPRSHRRRSFRPASWAPARSDSSNNSNNSNNAVPELLNATPPTVSSPTPSRRISQRINPFHRFSSQLARAQAHDAGSSSALEATPPSTPTRRPQSRLGRARSSLGSISGLLHSRPSVSHRSTEPVLSLTATPLSTARPRSALRQSHSETGPSLPHVPSIADLDLDFDSLLGNSTSRDRSDSNRSRSSLTPSSLRRDGRALSVLPRLRNTLGSRRRRSIWHDDENMDSIERLRRGEDQADVLSRLLSLAAAATAASLVGEDHQAATRDGTFDTFLQSLQNGSIASALRGNEGGEGGDNPGGTPAPLNFFRMFRFSTTANTTNTNSREPSRGSGSGSDAQDGEEDSEGRMVPIIIVGIRSINPASGTGQDDGNIPPFLDALSSFPTPPTSPGDNDTVLRPQNGTRFSHRRRASMGGFNFPSNYDSQRHHRTRPQEQSRPFSPSPADSPPGPQPPPSTPATNAALSADPSGSTTPTATTTPPSSTPHSNAPSRRGSFVRRSPGSTLEPTEEEPQTITRSPRQRRLSESDFTRYGAGAPRRRGVVEPDNNPGEGSRSWIIYVLGGSYPENHPILTTPSLFTDSPTYEDMMLLSSILGPAKAPVASEGDVAAAPGLFRIVRTVSGLVAQEVDGVETMELAADARCLVCLCDFEAEEEARKLVKCEHMFHKICIDQWLTTGRNSCPLCRGQGVDETPTPDVPEASTPPSSTPAPEAVA